MMKAEKIILLLPIALILVFTQCEKEPGIELVDIPDNAFLNALVEMGLDTDGDGLISNDEAKTVTFIDVHSRGIANMKGIEAFVNLDSLVCFNNLLTTLDISNCPALSYLSCGGNQLASLDVSNNTDLSFLKCGSNPLISLDISNNTALVELWCESNQLVSLDVTNNPSLYILGLRDMPTLKEVCVWTMPFPPEGVWVEKDGSPNVYFTTECSE